MVYTLTDIKENPNVLTYEVSWGRYDLLLRPLENNDLEIIAKFLEELSVDTRVNYVLDNYGSDTAREFCDSIARYDKLRFILLNEGVVIGLFEFSMDFPYSDKIRFENYPLTVSMNRLCRFGPCILDAYQGQGLVPVVFPSLIDIAKKLGKEGMILWGGVFADNLNAIKFYKKMGFVELGEFKNQDEKICKDMVLYF